MLNERKVLILGLGEEWGIDRIWDERTFKKKVKYENKGSKMASTNYSMSAEWQMLLFGWRKGNMER